MVGLVIFAIASLLGGLATERGADARRPRSPGWRAAHPAALALITTTFPAGPPRNRALAVYAAMSGAGAAIEPDPGRLLTGTD